MWLWITLATGAAAFSAAQDVSMVERGERIMNGNCTSCHDIRTIQTQAHDEEGWTKIVTSMIDMGAMLSKQEIPILVEYLVDTQGPLPDGPGKSIVLEKCTRCHTLNRVRHHFTTPEGWADTLSAMFNEGLSLSDEEFAAVLRYLARNFRQ
jgi:mono/diheme cytochrome c family protein